MQLCNYVMLLKLLHKTLLIHYMPFDAFFITLLLHAVAFIFVLKSFNVSYMYICFTS